MRLLSLTLENYGIFQAQRIAFDPTPGRINLLIAPNGAGKSILRNAFCDLLFGIHGQSPMGFRYGYGRMRLMAEAIGPNGTPLVFGRRKGQGNTLIGDDGRCTGHVDLGALGVGDRWADLAVASWSTVWNYGPGWEEPLYDAYGIAPDAEKIRYYRLLWSLG